MPVGRAGGQGVINCLKRIGKAISFESNPGRLKAQCGRPSDSGITVVEILRCGGTPAKKCLLSHRGQYHMKLRALSRRGRGEDLSPMIDHNLFRNSQTNARSFIGRF